MENRDERAEQSELQTDDATDSIGGESAVALTAGCV